MVVAEAGVVTDPCGCPSEDCSECKGCKDTCNCKLASVEAAAVPGLLL